MMVGDYKYIHFIFYYELIKWNAMIARLPRH